MAEYSKNTAKIDNNITILLLKALLKNNKINQSTYTKVLKIYKLKEVA